MKWQSEKPSVENDKIVVEVEEQRLQTAETLSVILFVKVKKVSVRNQKPT